MDFLKKNNQLSAESRVLLMESDLQDRELYSSLIQEMAHCKVDIMSCASGVLERMHWSRYQLIVLSEYPSGLLLLEQIKRMSSTTSVILVSSMASVEKAVVAMRMGAEDYLRKPLDHEVFRRAVKRGLDRKIIFGENMGVQQLMYIDDATGLYNTRYLNFVLEREIVQSQMSHYSFALLFIDLDRFKSINDMYGHLIGTKLLNELGRHLKTFVREKDAVFRYGGDEFVALVTPCGLSMAKAVAERIRKSVENKIFLKKEGLNAQFTVSIGVALFPDHGTTKAEIVEVADRAMYAAKKGLRNKVSVAGPTLTLSFSKKEASSGGF